MVALTVIIQGLVYSAATYAAAIEIENKDSAASAQGYSEKDYTEEQDFRFPIGKSGKSQTRTPFPQWLQAFTGLTEWPGSNPPYIPLDFIDFSKIDKWQPYKEGKCTANPKESCSFDCYKCVAHDDVYTCPKLSQSFDDGPSQHTITLLNNLKHKTTFFTLGMNVVDHPDVYKKIVENGHLTGTHTWSHPFLPSLSNEEIIAQLEWSIWAMNATGNHLPKWFRPPYGGIDNRVRSIARQFGLQSVLWDHDTSDWLAASNPFLRSESDILNDVRLWKKTPSGMILEHDGNRKTVEIGLKVSEIIGNDQMTCAECVGGIDYIRKF